MNMTIDLMAATRCNQTSPANSPISPIDAKSLDIDVEKPLVDAKIHELAPKYDSYKTEKDFRTFCGTDNYRSDSLSKKPLVETSGSDIEGKLTEYDSKDITDSTATYRDNDVAYDYDSCDVTSEDMENKCNEVLLMQDKHSNRYSIGDPLAALTLELPDRDHNSYRKSV